jgi:type I restriction enzyme M protein
VNQSALSAFIWSVADPLRGDFKQSEYGRVILPFTVLRRLDCVLEATKPPVLPERTKDGQSLCNTTPLKPKKPVGDPDHIRENPT